MMMDGLLVYQTGPSIIIKRILLVSSFNHPEEYSGLLQVDQSKIRKEWGYQKGH